MKDHSGAPICGYRRAEHSLRSRRMLLLYQILHYFGIVSVLEMRRKSLVPWEVLTIGLCAQVACLFACAHWLHEFGA